MQECVTFVASGFWNQENNRNPCKEHVLTRPRVLEILFGFLDRSVNRQNVFKNIMQCQI